MEQADIYSILFVGIDISSRENVVCFLRFGVQQPLKTFSVPNNQPGAQALALSIENYILEQQNHKDALSRVVVALESTSYYGIHIANYLSSCEELLPFKTLVYCLNPKMIANYKKSYIGLSKNDYIDAFIIADFARVGRISQEPWRGTQFIAVQRLTRHRQHITLSLTREKTYMLTNIFLKFSELAKVRDENAPFSNNYGATAAAVLTDFLSVEDIANTSLEELVNFICKKSRNRITDPEATAKLLQKAARDSYRLDKVLYEPLTVAIASSFNLITAYNQELKAINAAIEKSIKGLDLNSYTALQSIPGIGPVFAAGILSELGNIHSFKDNGAIAKYAGLVWRESQSGNFRAEDTAMSKAGNTYLRYYLLEATNSVIRHEASFKKYYDRKFEEVKIHKHQRALALTARKFVRLIYGLLAKGQLYSQDMSTQIQ